MRPFKGACQRVECEASRIRAGQARQCSVPQTARAVLCGRVEVDASHERLASHTGDLNAGADPENRQGLADASERYKRRGPCAGRGSSVGEPMVARRIAVEGLAATSLVRQRRSANGNGTLTANCRHGLRTTSADMARRSAGEAGDSGARAASHSARRSFHRPACRCLDSLAARDHHDDAVKAIAVLRPDCGLSPPSACERAASRRSATRW
ncbi:MAG: hypothetical protein JWO98_419 [Frankiales bacterium]|nr:hypothetical protein [Frankiales bacterium]